MILRGYIAARVAIPTLSTEDLTQARKQLKRISHALLYGSPMADSIQIKLFTVITEELIRRRHLLISYHPEATSHDRDATNQN